MAESTPPLRPTPRAVPLTELLRAAGPALADPADLASFDNPAAIDSPTTINNPAAIDKLTAPAVLVSGITLDSRTVVPGDLYVALPGARVHGARFAGAAVAAGAVAVLTDRAGLEQAEVPAGVPVVALADPRDAMAAVAAELYRRPAERMRTFAVTGTNGKTTTASMIDAALRAGGTHVGMIGTLGYYLDGVELPTTRTTVTTPESVDLQALLAVFAERGADALAMEVSSHALALHRVDEIVFDVAGFTTLGRDHLDFHHTIENYFEAKAELFTPAHCRAALVTVDEPWGVRLAERVAADPGVRLHTLSTRGRDADYRITGVRGEVITLAHPGGELEFRCALPGDYNQANAALALAMIDQAGYDLDTAAAGLAGMLVPGRMQLVPLTGDSPAAYVDFAHTPEAVRAALDAFAPRRAEGTRVVTVIGCGGDRDRSKRRPMGAAAAAGSDVVVVTDDNPRSEDPAAIRAETVAGAREADIPGVEIIDGGDRRSAIARSLELARPDGIVAVLGKGHEQGQDIGGRISPFDDASVLAEEWERLRGGHA